MELKMNKFATIGFMFCLMIISPQLNWAANSKVIEIQTKTNQNHKGVLLTVQPDIITIQEELSRQELAIPITDIIRIRYKRQAKFLKGLIIGLGSGYLVAGAGTGFKEPEDLEQVVYKIFPVMGIAIGAFIGAVTSSYKTIMINSLTLEKKQKVLHTLQRMARYPAIKNSTGNDSADYLPYSEKSFFNRFRLFLMQSQSNFRGETNTHDELIRYSFLAPGPIPENTTLSAIDNHNGSFEISQANFGITKLQLEYQFSPHWFVIAEWQKNAEIISKIISTILTIPANEQHPEMISYFGFNASIRANSMLLGISYCPIKEKFNGMFIPQLSLAAGPGWFSVKNYDNNKDPFFSHSANGWTGKVSAGIDYQWSKTLTLGFFAEYQIQQFTIQPQQLMCENLKFISYSNDSQMTQSIRMDTPSLNHTLYGSVFGFRLGIHF